MQIDLQKLEKLIEEKQKDNGAYEPRKLQREKVKEVLLSFRRSLQKVGSEYGGCSMTTFDYV